MLRVVLFSCLVVVAVLVGGCDLTPPTERNPGDVDGDGVVDLQDIREVLSYYGTVYSGDSGDAGE